MFTGIVQDTGEVVKIESGPTGGRRLWISGSVLEGAADGASVAVDGVCLTVTHRDGGTCRFDLSGETLERSSLHGRAAGDRVNLERPLRAGDELGGHLMQGHVDGVGTIRDVAAEGPDRRIVVSVPTGLGPYLVEKGSVAVDGVSLTVTRAAEEWFEVAVVPHTLTVTTLGSAEEGQRVNIEVDVIAKYVEQLLRYRNAGAPPAAEDSSGYL